MLLCLMTAKRFMRRDIPVIVGRVRPKTYAYWMIGRNQVWRDHQFNKEMTNFVPSPNRQNKKKTQKRLMALPLSATWQQNASCRSTSFEKSFLRHVPIPREREACQNCQLKDRTTPRLCFMGTDWDRRDTLVFLLAVRLMLSKCPECRTKMVQGFCLHCLLFNEILWHAISNFFLSALRYCSGML